MWVAKKFDTLTDGLSLLNRDPDPEKLAVQQPPPDNQFVGGVVGPQTEPKEPAEDKTKFDVSSDPEKDDKHDFGLSS